ncbi:hypothetical protein V202x_32820 [Gimesia aquarii]|uniref:Uncharacterized protein n=1 Tax=Gimesia aquarii TaxID=2527964 RepID=A0A517WX95_9PLAN|nr:hypothetical protein V202x_32820 [Gimesia aquarii]
MQQRKKQTVVKHLKIALIERLSLTVSAAQTLLNQM